MEKTPKEHAEHIFNMWRESESSKDLLPDEDRFPESFKLQKRAFLIGATMALLVCKDTINQHDQKVGE